MALKTFNPTSPGRRQLVIVDRSELHNLAAENPDKLRELVNLWYAEAGANEGFPLDDRSALEI